MLTRIDRKVVSGALPHANLKRKLSSAYQGVVRKEVSPDLGRVILLFWPLGLGITDLAAYWPNSCPLGAIGSHRTPVLALPYDQFWVFFVSAWNPPVECRASNTTTT